MRTTGATFEKVRRCLYESVIGQNVPEGSAGATLQS